MWIALTAGGPLSAVMLVHDSYELREIADESNGFYQNQAPLAGVNPQSGGVLGCGAYAANSSAMFYVSGPGLSYSGANMTLIGDEAGGGAYTMSRTGSAVTPIRALSANVGSAETLYIRFLTKNTGTAQLWVDFRLGRTPFSFYTKDGTTLDYFGSNIDDIPDALVENETNLILIEVNVAAGNDSVKLYVNPALNPDGSLNGTPLTTASVDIVDPGDDFVDLRINFGYGSTENNWFDEIAMGTELGDVMDSGQRTLNIAMNSSTPGTYDFEWKSRVGRVYDLVSSPDLATAPVTWPVWQGNGAMPAAVPLNSLTGVPGEGPRRFFAVIDRKPPPPVLANGSFESPLTDQGVFAALGAPWLPFEVPPVGLVETWHPGPDDYPSVADRENVCSVFFDGAPPAQAFGVSQTPGELFAADTGYSLTARVGRAAASGPGYAWPGFRIELWAGGTLLGFDEDPATTAPAAGSFITATVTYDPTVGPAATPGDPLEVRLLSRGLDVEGAGSAPGWAVEFDQVELELVPE